MVYTKMYIDEEEKGRKKSTAKALFVVLWILMIGVTMVVTVMSL